MEFKTGQTVSHYEIIEKIAQGGMGVVYKARDTKLDRIVALKFLTSELSSGLEEKERFLREAKAASKLAHANIGTIYEADEIEPGMGESGGQLFIAMAYYEGGSLRDRIADGNLSVGEVIQFSKQICLGLAKAHSAGIIHRDIKPGNVLVTPESEVKIVDFGLAKLIDHSRLTQTGARMGTISYMSPEQVQGGTLNAQTDVWSVGVILYEMLTGELPFEGEYDHAIMYSIVNEEPKALKSFDRNIPEDLIHIIEKALAKPAEKRFRSSEEMAAELVKLERNLDTTKRQRGAYKFQTRGRARRALGRILVTAVLLVLILLTYIWQSREVEATQVSIAVLPLKQMGETEDEEWFRDSMTDAMITDLTKIGGMRVIAQSSIRQYKETEKTIPEIGRELNVTHVLDGSIVRIEDDIRFSTRLVSIANNQSIWAENYQRPFRNVLQLQSEVARSIAEQVHVKLTPKEIQRLEQTQEVNSEAYAAYLRGVYLSSWIGPEQMKKSFAEFERAIDLQPDFAAPYAGLATAYASAANVGVMPSKEALPKAKAAAFEALRLDPNSSEAHAALGFVGLTLEWNWDSIERNLSRALELNPSSRQALQWYAFYLTTQGRHKESLAAISKAELVDPLSPQIVAFKGLFQYYARDYERALETYDRGLAMHNSIPILHYWKGAALLEMERYDEALASLQRSVELRGLAYDCHIRPFIVETYVHLGQRQKALDLLAELEAAGCSPIVSYIALGEYDRAFSEIEKKFIDPDWIPLFKVGPWFDPIRSDPRFKDVLRRAGLED